MLLLTIPILCCCLSAVDRNKSYFAHCIWFYFSTMRTRWCYPYCCNTSAYVAHFFITRLFAAGLIYRHGDQCSLPTEIGLFCLLVAGGAYKRCKNGVKRLSAWPSSGRQYWYQSATSCFCPRSYCPRRKDTSRYPSTSIVLLKR